MFKVLRDLWDDRRGNVLVVMGAAMPLLIGSAGLASDTIQWALWKRELQRMADSAAMAGAYAKAQSATLDNCANYASATYSQPIGYDVRKNNRVWPTLTCVAASAPTSGSYAGDQKAVQVTVSVQQRLPFTGYFMSSVPRVHATATAKMVQTGSYCLVALNNTSDPSITMAGSSSANLGCGAISDSTNATSAISTIGNAYSFTATPVASAGGMPTTVIGSTDVRPFQIPEPDPFEGLYSTDVPLTTTCNTFSGNSYNTNPAGQVTSSNGSNVTHRLKAGCYTDFSPSGNTIYYLDPGVYYLKNTNFNPGGSVSLIGSNVTFILTGTTPGSVSLNSNVSMQLRAPSTGTYAKMLFIQSAAAALNNTNTFNGNSSSYFDGAFYLPKGNVTLSGSTAGQTKCVMIVSWTTSFSGNSALQNNTTGCTANKTVPAYVVKLVG